MTGARSRENGLVSGSGDEVSASATNDVMRTGTREIVYAWESSSAKMGTGYMVPMPGNDGPETWAAETKSVAT